MRAAHNSVLTAAADGTAGDPDGDPDASGNTGPGPEVANQFGGELMLRVASVRWDPGGRDPGEADPGEEDPGEGDPGEGESRWDLM